MDCFCESVILGKLFLNLFVLILSSFSVVLTLRRTEWGVKVEFVALQEVFLPVKKTDPTSSNFSQSRNGHRKDTCGITSFTLLYFLNFNPRRVRVTPAAVLDKWDPTKSTFRKCLGIVLMSRCSFLNRVSQVHFRIVRIFGHQRRR